MKNKYIWLSYPLSNDTLAYSGSKGFKISKEKSMKDGDSCNTSTWLLSSHVGTHVDAPKHFDDHGLTIDQFEPGFWIFASVCVVEVQFSQKDLIIGKEDVEPYLTGYPEILFIKTGMGKYRDQKFYWETNPGLSPALAKTLKEQYPSLRAVGIDSISISSWQNRELGREAHRAFLEVSVK